MACIFGNVDWIAELIPSMREQLDQFVVEAEEIDDELLLVFIDELKRLTGEMQAGLRDNDANAVRSAAHSIKGMGGTIGFPELSVLGLTIENTAKENRLQDAIPLVDALMDWLSTFA